MGYIKLENGESYPAATPVTNYEHRILMGKTDRSKQKRVNSMTIVADPKGAPNPKFDGPDAVIPLVDPRALGVPFQVDWIYSSAGKTTTGTDFFNQQPPEPEPAP